MRGGNPRSRRDEGHVVEDEEAVVRTDEVAKVTLYSPEYFGQQLPAGQRAGDRISAAKAAHYCTSCRTKQMFHLTVRQSVIG